MLVGYSNDTVSTNAIQKKAPLPALNALPPKFIDNMFRPIFHWAETAHGRFRYRKPCNQNKVSGPSRSLEKARCDTARMISYVCSVVTTSLSLAVSVIFNSANIWNLK